MFDNNKKSLKSIVEENIENSNNNYDLDNEQNNLMDNYMNNITKLGGKKRNKLCIEKNDVSEMLSKYKTRKLSKNSDNNNYNENNDIDCNKVNLKNIHYDDNNLENCKESTNDNNFNIQNNKHTINLFNKEKDKLQANSVLNQQKIYYSLIGIRLLMQDILLISNTFPQTYNFNIFKNLLNSEDTNNLELKESNSLDKLQEKLIDSKNLLRELLLKIVTLTNKSYLLELLKKIILRENKNENMLNNQSIMTKKLIVYFKKVINTWYKNTMTVKKSNNLECNEYNIENFTDNIDNNIEKYYTNFRNKTNYITINNNLLFKDLYSNILGLSIKGKLSTNNDEIFNDIDFYNMLLNNFVSYNQVEDDDNNNNNMYNTLALLKKNQVNRNKNKLTSKLSKNKIIKYDTHEKIINFMIPEDNPNEFNGRDEFLQKLFNKKTVSFNADITKNNGLKVDIKII